jgi:hypothetical protein
MGVLRSSIVVETKSGSENKAVHWILLTNGIIPYRTVLS